MARIILVEEDEDRRAALQRALRQAGHQVIAFAESEPALAQLRAAPADLLLLDWWMPARWPLLVERERLELPVVGIQRPAEPGEVLATVDEVLSGEALAEVIPIRQHPLDRLAARLGSLAAVLPAAAAHHPELQAAVGQAQLGAARAEAIARYVRTFGRPRSDEPRVVDVGRVVTRAAELALPELKLRAQLVLSLGAAPKVIAREFELGHACFHLLVNATQALSDGGPETNRIELSTGVDRDGQAIIEIADNGHGIAPARLERVGELFFTTKGGDGRGTGLWLCQATVAAHGGDLTVESRPGRTVFRISLPPAENA